MTKTKINSVDNNPETLMNILIPNLNRWKELKSNKIIRSQKAKK